MSVLTFVDDSILIPVVAALLALWVAVYAAEVIWKVSAKRRPFGLYREPMECPQCKEISFSAISVVTLDTGHAFVEYECEECKYYATM